MVIDLVSATEEFCYALGCFAALFICIKGTYYENYANLNDAPNLYRQYEPEWVSWRDHLHALLRQVK